MASFPLLLICVTLLSVMAEAQNCVKPTETDISTALDSIVVAISGQNIQVTLLNFTFSCFSVGTMRNRFRHATVIVVFKTNVTFQDSACTTDAGCKAYYEISCEVSTNQWITNPLSNVRSLTIDANAPLNLISPRTDCGSCGIEDSVPPIAMANFDNITHCFVCDPTCFDEGLSLCQGLTDDVCCNFYQDSICTNECGDRRIATLATNFSCICNNSFTGSDCSVCSISCQSGGTLNNDYCFCDCAPGYTGNECEVDINECANNPCVNGQCIDQINGFQCRCFPDYNGTLCDNKINDCVSVNCNNGTCIDGINNFTCQCDPDFTGIFCDTKINDCLPNPCQNGVCIDGVNNFTCDCFDNYSGRTCDTCDLKNCKNCSTTLGICNECDNPFVIRNGTCVSICDTVTCVNGDCIDFGNGSLTCQCNTGYTGDDCNTNINDCDPNPCQNGGRCNDGIASFTCTCIPNFSGSLCNNCVIDNCVNCSMTSGVCNVCKSGYKPGVNKGCVKDIDLLCVNDPDQYLCQWKILSRQCGFIPDKCNIKMHTYTPYKSFRKRYDCYKKLQKQWKKRASASISGLTPVEEATTEKHQNNFQRLVQRWRKSLEQALESLDTWIKYYKSELGITLSPVPNLDTANGNPEDLYKTYINYWNSLFNRFADEAVPSQCPDK